jgi:multidrug efflux pump subunit AcrA (membrane-fusion protein)
MEMDEAYISAQIDISAQKAALEAEVSQSQIRIADIQAQGISARNEIDLALARAQLAYSQNQLALLADLDKQRAELEAMKIEAEKENLEWSADMQEEQRSSQPLTTVAQPAPISQEKSIWDYVYENLWIPIIAGTLLLAGKKR